MAELSVELTANIARLKSQLVQAEKLLGNYSGNVEKQGAVAASGLNKTSTAIKGTTPTILEFNRVIQDAPFGIQGVANNLTQLVSSFSVLKSNAGGTGAAFKSLAANFLGSGGILFAVSLVTSALVFFGTGMFKSKTAAEKLAATIKENAEALEKYESTLIGVNKAQLAGNKSAADELVTLRLLRSQIENTTLSTEERTDGIKKLQKEFPEYFKNVDKEKILNGQVSATYDTLTNSIIKRARATAASDLLVENAKKEFAINQQISDLNDRLGLRKIELAKAATKEQINSNVIAGGSGSFSARLIEQAAVQGKINDLTKEQIEFQKQLATIATENLALEAQVTDNIIVVPELTIEPKKIKIKTGKFKNDFRDLGEIFGITKQGETALNSRITALGTSIQNSLNLVAERNIRPAVDNLTLRFQELTSNLNELALNSINDALGNVGNAIGVALASGGNVIQAIGGSILQSLGQFLSKMGDMLIQYGTLAVVKGKLDLAILLGPAASIGAGLAAIAVGVALKAAGGALGTAARGGTGGGGNVGGQGSSNFSGAGGGGGGGATGSGVVVFEIAGEKLVGVLSRTLDRNKRLGGNLGLVT
jgi:ribosomal protein L21